MLTSQSYHPTFVGCFIGQTEVFLLEVNIFLDRALYVSVHCLAAWPATGPLTLTNLKVLFIGCSRQLFLVKSTKRQTETISDSL